LANIVLKCFSPKTSLRLSSHAIVFSGAPLLALRNARRAAQLDPHSPDIAGVYEKAESVVLAHRPRPTLSQEWSKLEADGPCLVGHGGPLEAALLAYREGKLILAEGFLLTAGYKLLRCLRLLRDVPQEVKEQVEDEIRAVEVSCRVMLADVCLRRNREYAFGVDCCGMVLRGPASQHPEALRLRARLRREMGLAEGKE
jgi:hypothetical protein